MLLNSFQNAAPGSCGSLPEQRQGTLTSAPALTASLYSCNTSKGPLWASSFAWQIQNLANFSAWGTRDSTVEISSARTPCKEKGKSLKKGVHSMDECAPGSRPCLTTAHSTPQEEALKSLALQISYKTVADKNCPASVFPLDNLV